MTFALAALAVLATITGCHEKLSEPTNHRPVAVVCPAYAPSLGKWQSYQAVLDACATDTDCTAAPNGHCGLFTDGGQQETRCFYDQCREDSDCPSGGVCACGQGGGGSDICLRGGLSGSCHVDADCGSNEFCSLADTLDVDTTRSYFCHGSDDECGGDADCPREAPFCLYNVHHWKCMQGP